MDQWTRCQIYVSRVYVEGGGEINIENVDRVK